MHLHDIPNSEILRIDCLISVVCEDFMFLHVEFLVSAVPLHIVKRLLTHGDEEHKG